MNFNFNFNFDSIKFMIIDCDDDKVDLITRKHDKNIKRSGNFCGEADIIKEFLDFIENKVGTDALKSLRENHYESLQKMIQEFSSEIKSSFTGNKDNYETYEMDLDSVCPNIKKYLTGSKFLELEDNDWLIDFEFDDVKAMFDPIINIIINLVNEHFDRDISFIFLAGSLSGIKYLQNRIIKEFSDRVKHIIVTPLQNVEATQGALYYGLQLNTN
ncbi:hypothetical protein GLOIN_2v357334 [Rhizophagus clarus]|nr:hypothetical protein GLOIN_2v357334 [Rhizophagus clarus]